MTSLGTGLHDLWFSSVFYIGVYLLRCLFVCTWTGDGKSSVHALENDMVNARSAVEHTNSDEPVVQCHASEPSHNDVFEIFFPDFCVSTFTRIAPLAEVHLVTLDSASTWRMYVLIFTWKAAEV